MANDLNSTNRIDTDFIGFKFNGIHSSTYNIVRISDGSRFNENLLPDFTDITSDRGGADGTFYFGSNYKKRTISFGIAYDSVTEEDLHNMKQWLSCTDLAPLIFDELPFKMYYAKIVTSPTISFICFFENNRRIYKGEGTISFVLYEPFSLVPYTISYITLTSSLSSEITLNIPYKNYKKFLNDYTDSNKNEWKGSSRMYETSIEPITGVTIDLIHDSYIDLYNPGDQSVPFKIYLKRNNIGSSKLVSLSEISLFSIDDTRTTLIETLGVLKFNFSGTSSQFSAYASEYLVLNSNNRLIEGFDKDNNKTGEIFNQYITQGNFFLIPPGKTRMVFSNLGEGTALYVEYPYQYL